MPDTDNCIRVARNAMATRFEILLHGGDPARLRAAAEEALDEIERLDAILSPYRAASEISRINARAATGPVRVAPEIFALLRHAARLSVETGGAFDMTIGPLMRCWRHAAGEGRVPDGDELEGARAATGMEHVLLNEQDFTVQFARPGMRLDVGAIGKGFALDRAEEILREAGVGHALLHGGTSTVSAMGCQPDGRPWKVAIDGPPAEDAASPSPVLATVDLHEESLSVSAVWGRVLRVQDREYGHILDPRTGHPASDADLAAVILPSATETDALSTALLTVGRPGRGMCSLRNGMRWLLLSHGGSGKPTELECFGIEASQVRPDRS